MSKTVFTYYDPIPTWNHREIVNIWKHNWNKAGFRPIVMNRRVAKRHPMFGNFLTRIRTFPTVNDPRYEEACYIRWLAFEVMLDICPDGRGTMSDYDVFNNGFDERHMGREDIVLHELTRVPCLVTANKAGARRIVEFIMSREPDHSTGHYSDMYAFKESDWPITGHCLEFGEKRGEIPWRKAPTIHAASGVIQREAPGYDKTKYIRDHYGT